MICSVCLESLTLPVATPCGELHHSCAFLKLILLPQGMCFVGTACASIRRRPADLRLAARRAARSTTHVRRALSFRWNIAPILNKRFRVFQKTPHICESFLLSPYDDCFLICRTLRLRRGLQPPSQRLCKRLTCFGRKSAVFTSGVGRTRLR